MKKILAITALSIVSVFALGGLYNTYAADENVVEVNSEASFVEAVASSTVTNIKITGDFTTVSVLNINRPIIIDGNDKTISGNKIDILSNDVSITNLTVKDSVDYGIQAYRVTGIKLENIKILNPKKGGIVVNGSMVTLGGEIILENNPWGGIDVSKGKGVTEAPKLNINGAKITYSGEGFVIWSDDDTAVIEEGSNYTKSYYATGQAAYINTSCINNQNELFVAIANSSVKEVALCKNISLTKKVTINRDFKFIGNGNKVSLVTSSWSGTPDQNGEFTKNGNFVFKVIEGAKVSFEKITIDGGAAAIQSYGSSTVTTKDVTISGTAFGGISVNTDTVGALVIEGSLTYDNTNNTDAVVWLDTRNTHDDVNVLGYAAVGLTPAVNPAKTNELWYVKNNTCVSTQAELENAINKSYISKIKLCDDITTNKQITISRSIEIDGNSKILTSSFDKTGPDNDSIIGINASSVKINNIVINGNNKNIHGIDVFDTNDVVLNNVNLKNNGRSGLNIVSSEVKVNNISTSKNVWHGIDVDLSNGSTTNILAKLTVNGTSTHSDEVGGDIYIDNTTKNVSVVDTNNQYKIKEDPSGKNQNDRSYTLKTPEEKCVESGKDWTNGTCVNKPTPSYGGGGGGGIAYIPPTSGSATPVITWTNATGTATTSTSTIGQVLGATAFQFTKNMKLDSTGSEVKALQKFLNATGFAVSTKGTGSKGNETEYFGARTKAALIKYQEANISILTKAGITNGKGTGNFLASTMNFVNEILLKDSVISASLEN